MLMREKKHCCFYDKRSHCRAFGRMLETEQCLTRHLGLFHCLEHDQPLFDH